VEGLTRRGFVARALGAAGTLATAGRAKAAPAFDGTIRVANIGYDLLEPIRKRAEKDLGFSIASTVETLPQLERWVRQVPGTYDVFAGAQEQIRPLWAAGGLQPVEIAAIDRWREVAPLFKLGKLRPGDPRCTYGQGAAGFRVLYVDPDRSGRWRSASGTPRQLDGLIVEWADETTGRPVGQEPRFCAGVPHVFNFDSLGYNARVIRKRPEQVSWAELFNSRWGGRVALVSGSDIGMLDAANAARAAGLVGIRDLGDLTNREADTLVKLLLAYKKRGHFFNIAEDFFQPADWMRHGEVVIESMFAISIAQLAALGFPVRQAAPPEGYRAFSGMLSISSEVRDRAKLKACYDFINWWQSGFAGSVLMRDGYYNAVQATSRRFVAPGEYAYWIEGKPADRNYAGPFGDVSVREGQTRDGGSFARRACRISVWNTRAREYVAKRWNEFELSF
jgi:putative spermidine/putrescine transport system substrate-binding protein